VGDIPLAMQVKLLRLLESGTYRRVGSNALRRTDVRVVSATHRDLKAMVADGRFREDLHYRLSTFPIALPALRERADDIALLAVTLLAGPALAIDPAASRVTCAAAVTRGEGTLQTVRDLDTSELPVLAYTARPGEREFKQLALMEDVDMVRRLGRKRILILRTQALTSAIRYKRDGYIRRSARNIACLGLYMLRAPMPLIQRLYGAGRR